MANDRVLGRIAALLRKAEGTDNECEAIAYMEAAQRIATAAAIDLASARGYNTSKGPQLVQETITIGKKGTKGLKSYVKLFVAIARANDIQCDILSDSTTIFIFGYDSDICICQELYQSLLVQMVVACQEYLLSDEHKSSVQESVQYIRRYGMRRRVIIRKPVATITARLNFYTAYADRIGKLLLAARKKEIKTYEENSGTFSQALILLKNKNDAVQEYYKQISSAQGNWTLKQSSYAHTAHLAGDAAAYRARFSQQNIALSETPRQLAKH